MSDLLRVYYDPAEIGPDGYPVLWHHALERHGSVPIKNLIRERDDHRCLRCRHPYRKGEHGSGEWSPCDERCTHGRPFRVHRYDSGDEAWVYETDAHYLPNPAGYIVLNGAAVEAQWRILTVHHLNGVKHDCRWWNLVSLCQRCHLSVQTRVVMDRAYNREHSEWFRPFAAAFYADKYLGEDLSREQVNNRLDELLALELNQPSLF